MIFRIILMCTWYWIFISGGEMFSHLRRLGRFWYFFGQLSSCVSSTYIATL